MKRLFGVLGAMTLLAGWAGAQSGGTGSAPSTEARKGNKPPRAVVQSCRADVKRLCPEAAGSGSKAVVGCLVQKKDQLEPGCKSALKHAKRVQAFRRACGPDVKKLCTGVDPGNGRIVACLKEHQDEVSAECKKRATARKGGQSGENVAAVADEAVAEEQAGAEPIDEELQALPEDPVVPPSGAQPPGR
jgi:Cysteine rich repeat